MPTILHKIECLLYFQILFAILILLFLIPAAIFASLEPKWGYLDSMYYCFISLTTVGLGDFIPGDTPGQNLRPLYKALTTSKQKKLNLQHENIVQIASIL